MNWILILILWIPGSIETREIAFNSQEACETAVARIKADFKEQKAYVSVNATCNRRT